MTDKQSADLIATDPIVRRTACIERVMGSELSLPTQTADYSAMWTSEKLACSPADSRRIMLL